MDMSSREDLLIFSNGPGEISTWVFPVVDEFRRRKELSERYRVILIIHPCQFGSGTEHEVVKRVDSIEWVIKPREYMKLLIIGLGKKKYSFSREGIIFSLGGDLMHPVLFKKRIRGKHALYAYTNNTGWEKHYKKIFMRSEYIRSKFLDRSVPESKLIVSGDLVYSSLKSIKDRADVRKELSLSENERMVVFMPGSRFFSVKYMVPIFLKVIDDLTERIENLRFFILKSPYISYEHIRESLTFGGKIKEAESIPGILQKSGDGYFGIMFSVKKEVRILEGQLDYWGSGIDLAVTLPGTNTIQLAYRGIPALVLGPLNKPELIPIEGTAGLLKWVPLIGKPILQKAVMHYIKRFPFASLPNLYMNEEIFPELNGILTTDSITTQIARILGSGEERVIKKRLDRFKLDHDPAESIVDAVWG